MTATFAEFVEQRFGALTKGGHNPDGAACYHEAQNVYEGREWSDDTSGTIDLRPLNDAPWSSDAARTEAMFPLYAITSRTTGWPTWTPERRQAWAKLVAEGVIRRILPPTLRAVAERVPSKAPDLVVAALRCETEGSESAWSAASAARAAWSAASAASASAAWSAASAASAAWSARSAARAAESAWSAARSAASAWSAARAARSAEWAAESADAPLQELCRIYLEAEEATRA